MSVYDREDGDGAEVLTLTGAHAKVLQALMWARPEGGFGYHEAQIAYDLGMNVEDVRRYLVELSRLGLAEEAP